MGDLLPVKRLSKQATRLGKILTDERRDTQVEKTLRSAAPALSPCIMRTESDNCLSPALLLLRGSGLGVGKREQSTQESLAEQEGKSLARWGVRFPGSHAAILDSCWNTASCLIYVRRR